MSFQGNNMFLFSAGLQHALLLLLEFRKIRGEFMHADPLVWPPCTSGQPGGALGAAETQFNLPSQDIWLAG